MHPNSMHFACFGGFWRVRTIPEEKLMCPVKFVLPFACFHNRTHTKYTHCFKQVKWNCWHFAISEASQSIRYEGIQRGIPWVWIVSCILTKEIHCSLMVYQCHFASRRFPRYLNSNSQIAEKPRFKTERWIGGTSVSMIGGLKNSSTCMFQWDSAETIPQLSQMMTLDVIQTIRTQLGFA